MAHVETNKLKSGRTSYTVRYRDHTGTEQRKTFRTAADAKAFRSEIEVEKTRGGSLAAFAKKGQSYREVAEAMLAAHAHRQKDKTRESYDLAYRVHIFPTFGHRAVNTITSMEVEAWLADMRTKTSARTGKPLSESSVHGAWIALSKAFDYALRHRLINLNPCKAITKPRVAKKERRFLLPGEVAALGRILDATAPNGLILRFAAYTGLREGELAALRVGDVMSMGTVAREVRVGRTLRRVKGGWKVDTPKTTRSVRKVPLSGALREELTAYLDAHPYRSQPDAALWPGRIPGSAGDERGLDYDRQFDIGSLIRYYFKPALTQLGLSGIRWHDLRHFYASALLATKRFSLFEVSKWMGHASIATTTDLYGHLLDTTPDMDAFDALMAGADAAPNVTPLRPRRAAGE